MTPQIAAEAAVWVARLHGPSRSRTMERECLEWQGSSAAHRLAFERCTDTWQDVPRISLASALSATAGSTPAWRGRHWWWENRRAALALTLGVFALGGIASLGFEQWRAAGSYATGVGEQQVVMLEDGTRMSLNTSTRVRVDLSAHQRTVSVYGGGEALFEVASDPKRPFVVRMGAAEVVAVGTVFSVRQDDDARPGRDALAVTLLEGKVKVRLVAAGGGKELASAAPLVMEPGERLRLVKPQGATDMVLARDRPRVDQVVAWRRSEAVFDDVSLGDAVDEMNRYSRKPIVLVGGAPVATRRVSGSFRTGDNVAFARAVAALHGLVLQERPRRLELAAAQ